MRFNTFQHANAFGAEGVDLSQGFLLILRYHAHRNRRLLMTSISTRKIQLETRLADLKGRLSGIEAELDSHQSSDWEELATEREGDEVLEGMGLTGQLEIRRIEAALERIASGEYGICAKCGAEIGDARLDVLPYTPFCRNCAA
jgi:RNA polymerase-binding transcription factor DksA